MVILVKIVSDSSVDDVLDELDELVKNENSSITDWEYINAWEEEKEYE